MSADNSQTPNPTNQPQDFVTLVRAEFQTLTNQIAHLNEQLNSSRTTSAAEITRLQEELRQTQASASSSSGLRPPVPRPDRYDGSDRREFKNFQHAVNNVFAIAPEFYTTEESRIRFAGGFLSGTALAWFRSMCTPPNTFPTTLADFWAKMEKQFGHTNQFAVRQELRRLKQKGMACSTYATRFRTLALDTGFDDKSLLDTFYEGLNYEIQEAISNAATVPDSLDEFIEYCIAIDNRKFALRNAKRGTLPPPSAAPPSSSASGPQPMELGALQSNKLTPEERQRRLDQKLCLYCGKPGHRIAQCPLCHPNGPTRN